jgi:hypothetical protein
LTTPLCCTGTAEELDRELPTHLRDFVSGHVTLSNNLAQIQRDREEAEKTAREELNKKRKSAGNGVAKNKTPEAKPPDEEKAPPQPSMLSLFDSPAEVPPVEQSSPAAPDRDGSIATPSNSTGGER